jgi:hypothetical protein
MEEHYMRKSGTMTHAMQRIDACHEVAKAVTEWPGTKRELTALGIDREDVLVDCAAGVHLSAKTLVMYGYVRGWRILHCKGCVCFVTGDGDPEYVLDHDVPSLRKTDDAHLAASGGAPPCTCTEMRATRLELTNVTRPLRSVHMYKHGELLEMYERVKWHIPSSSPSSLYDRRSTKKQLYEALEATVEGF